MYRQTWKKHCQFRHNPPPTLNILSWKNFNFLEKVKKKQSPEIAHTPVTRLPLMSSCYKTVTQLGETRQGRKRNTATMLWSRLQTLHQFQQFSQLCPNPQSMLLAVLVDSGTVVQSVSVFHDADTCDEHGLVTSARRPSVRACMPFPEAQAEVTHFWQEQNRHHVPFSSHSISK